MRVKWLNRKNRWIEFNFFYENMPHSLIFWLRNKFNTCAVPNIISILFKVEHATLNIQFVYGIRPECYLNLMSMNQNNSAFSLPCYTRCILFEFNDDPHIRNTKKDFKLLDRLLFSFFFFLCKMLISFRLLAQHCSLLNLKSSTSRYIIYLRRSICAVNAIDDMVWEACPSLEFDW